jgi:hypothetical protein
MAATDLITKALGWLEDAGQIAAGWLCRLRLVPVIVRVLPPAEGKAGVIATARRFALRFLPLLLPLTAWCEGAWSNRQSASYIKAQDELRPATRELAVKAAELAIYRAAFLLLMSIMGIDLTAVAVLGGALGVGIGFGVAAGCGELRVGGDPAN